MGVSWLINGGDPNHLLTGMILQVGGLGYNFPYGFLYDSLKFSKLQGFQSPLLLEPLRQEQLPLVPISVSFYIQYPPGIISPKNGILKMIFLFPRWDMLIPWRVISIVYGVPSFFWLQTSTTLLSLGTRDSFVANPTRWARKQGYNGYNSPYRGYNPSYPFLRPFIEVISTTGTVGAHLVRPSWLEHLKQIEYLTGWKFSFAGFDLQSKN